jgi:NADH dehydrogenase (ubiquinone) Fe-S protein 3
MKNNISYNILVNYRDYLKKVFPHLAGYVLNGELIIKTTPSKIIKLLYFLKNNTLSQYKILSDMSAVDFPQKKNRFEILYNILSINYNSRLTVLVSLNEKTLMESCTSIYSAAG